MTLVHHVSLKAYYVLGSHATLIRCNWRDDGPVGGYGELKFILTCNKMKPLHVMWLVCVPWTLYVCGMRQVLVPFKYVSSYSLPIFVQNDGQFSNFWNMPFESATTQYFVLLGGIRYRHVHWRVFSSEGWMLMFWGCKAIAHRTNIEHN